MIDKTHSINMAGSQSESLRKDGYFSQFGGLWIDRGDFLEILESKLARGELTAQDADDLRFYEEHGYIIFKGAVDPGLCDEYAEKFDRIWHDPPPTLWVSEGGQTVAHDVTQVNRIVKAGDFHYYFEKAPSIVFPDRVLRFLRLIYEKPPVVFQSMTCRKGTQEPLHCDTGPLSLTEPMSLAASWLALEDVVEGSGELQYVPKSHRVPEHLVNGKTKAHHGDMGGYYKVLQGILEECRARNYEVESFMAKKGDVLIWAADLMHGGKPIIDQSQTRLSFICHFMPYGVMPTFYDSSAVNYVDYGNGGYCLDRYDPDEVSFYNNPDRLSGQEIGTLKSGFNRLRKMALRILPF